MYVCDNCGILFMVPNSYTECLTMDPPAYEKRSQSPCCGAGYERAHECPVCGLHTKTERPDGLCDGCAKDAVESLREFLSKFHISELRWLDQLLDGVSLEEFWNGE